MAETNGNGKYIPWVWVAGIMMAILISIAGVSLTQTQADIRYLQEKKVDKEQYYHDVQSINYKLDCLIKIQMDRGNAK